MNNNDSRKSFMKIRNLIDYFVNKDKIDVTSVKYASPVKLEKMITIFNSELNDINKYDMMKKLFSSPENFMETFSYLLEYRNNDFLSQYAEMVSQIGNYYIDLEQKGIKMIGKDLLDMENNHYFDDYPYAASFVCDYIDYDESPYLSDFLKSVNLKEFQFNRFLSIVLELNNSLYEKYLIKYKENENIRKENALRKIQNIKDGVTNEIESGEKYDILDYYRNIPFYSISGAQEMFNDFGLRKGANLDQKMKILISSIEPESANMIIKYIERNCLFFGYYPKEVKESDIRDTNYIIDGFVLTDEDKDNIIEYMKKNNLPFVTRVYSEVKNRYVKNELDIEDDKKLKK